jgi:ECF transporter S component (folate family)
MATKEKNRTLYSHPFSKAYWRDAAAELKSTRTLVIAALLIALRVALKTVVIPLAPNLNINVAAPLINALGAMIFGPVVAAAAALVSDTLGCIIFPQGPYFFPCAFVEVAGSVLFALFFYRTKMRPTRVILARFSMDLFVNIILNSAVMFWYFQVFYQKSYVEMLLPAIIKNLCMFPIEAFVLTLFLSVIIPVTYKLGLTHDASADKNSMKFTTKQFALLLTLFAVGVGGLLTYLNYHYQTKSLSASYSTSERVEKNQLMQEFVVEESDEYDNVETITIVESAFKEFFTGKITYSVAIYEVTTPLDAEQEEACWKYSKSKAKKDENLTFQSYATIVVDKGGDVVSFELD